jgi:hypothetical protein
MALKPRAPHPEEKYVSVITSSQLAGKFYLAQKRFHGKALLAQNGFYDGKPSAS